MGPKKAEVKKKTKKELKAEEEERKKKEEQERKIREQKEEIERKRLEMLRKQEQQRLAQEQKMRLDEQEAELKTWQIELDGKRLKSEKAYKLETEWEKTKVCDKKPDTDQEGEITTFITQYKESEGVFEKDVLETLKQMQYSEKVVEDIYDRLIMAAAENRTEIAQRYENFIQEIRNITNNKVHEITSFMTLNSEVMYDERVEESNKKLQNEANQKTTFAKTDDKFKLEIYKTYPPLQDFRYGIWLNYNPKSSGGGYRHKPIDFGQTLIQCDLPRTFMSISILMKCYWTSFDFLSDPSKYSPSIATGGVLNIQCIKAPLPATKRNQWVLRPTSDIKEAVDALPYPDSMASLNSVTSFQVYYTLPPYLFMVPNLETYKVAYFDFPKDPTQKGGVWTHEFIEDIKYEHEKRLLTFNASKLAPYALMQDRCTDYPYKEWHLRCISKDKAVLDIKGRRQQFRFEIGTNYAILKDRKDPELAHIAEKPMSVPTLLNKLLKSGINLMPCRNDAETAHICDQDQKAEKLAINDVSIAVRSYFIKSSRYSNEVGPQQVLLRIKENLEYDLKFHEDQEKDWKTMSWWGNKVAVIKARDSHMTCNEQFRDDTVAHTNLEVLLKKHQVAEFQIVQQQAIDRMHETQHLLFSDTVARFLQLTKLLTFTAEQIVG